MFKEATTFGLEFESHFINSLQPDPVDKQHNERKGIYRARKEYIRKINGPVHKSVKKRRDADAYDYCKNSKSLNQLLRSVDGDWAQIDLSD